MGAWGYGIFDDDSAYDVMEELQQCDDVAAYLEKTFVNGVSAEYLEFDEGIAVSVCGAVFDSILHGTSYRFDGFNSTAGSEIDGTEQYLNWIAEIKTSDCTHLKTEAVKAMESLISEQSELCELWADAGEFQDWKNTYLEIIQRMNA